MTFKQIGLLVVAGSTVIYVATMDQAEIKIETANTIVAMERHVPAAPVKPRLWVLVSDEFEEHPWDGGRRYVQVGDLRTPIMVSLPFEPNISDFDPQGYRDTDLGKASFQIDETDGGSGGQTYELCVLVETEDGPLMVKVTQQSEVGVPSFERAWDVFSPDSMRF